MANVLVIGGGGREQALAWKLAQSPAVERVYVAPGNGGSADNIENVDVGFADIPALVALARDRAVDLTVIGQEAASDAGAVDAFKAAGLTIFGPTQAATKLEASKVFSKDLMATEHIPTAEFRTFTSPSEAATYAKSRPYPVVIKADGLATGKGVIIAQDAAQVDEAIDIIMVKRAFGDAGEQVVVEDFLRGQEVSVHALCDGRTAVIFPASQDHKQVFDGDQGANTGGMGVIAPVPWVTPRRLQIVRDKVVVPALDGLQRRGAAFTGCMYPGLMIDGDEIKVLEFNARFGDPEAEVYMRLFDGDLYEVLKACALGELDPDSVRWKPGFAVSIVLCSEGYPGDYPKGRPISGLDEAAKLDNIVIFHAATRRENGRIITNGGRVLNVTATGATLDEALDRAYGAVKLISFDGMHYRTDIGRRVAV